MKLWAIVPELIVAGLCLALVPVAGWVRGRGRWIPLIAALVGLTAALAVLLEMRSWSPVSTFHGAFAVDGLSTAVEIVLVTGALVTLLFFASHHRGREQLAHAPLAILFATLGGMGLVSSRDLGLIILFVQMMSMAVYVLLAMERRDRLAQEALLEYFLYGAVALAIMAYGLTFLYGLTGSLDLGDIGAALGGRDRVWIAVALIAILVGYGFEIALVPFHAWAPDVFTGTSAPVAGFLSVVPKAAAVAALARFLVEALPGELVAWPYLIALLAVVTMFGGNIVALRQRGMKRLLAWSSIAQSGYLLAVVAVAARTREALPAIAFYLGVYVFMNLAAFGVVGWLERSGIDDRKSELRGLARTSPALAAVLALALLSLAGIPPLAGFAGKIFLFRALFVGDMAWLAAASAAAMVIALYYYVDVIAEMYLHAPPRRRRTPRVHWGYVLGLALAVTALLFFGVAPAAGLALVDAAARLHG